MNNNFTFRMDNPFRSYLLITKSLREYYFFKIICPKEIINKDIINILVNVVNLTAINNRTSMKEISMDI